MKCVNHLDKDAVTICNHCGRSICTDCQVARRGEIYCQDCLSGKEVVKEKRSPALAGFLSFLIAGLGQFYNGQAGKGIAIFLTSIFVVPWIIGIFDAVKTARKINQGKITLVPKKGCLIAFAIGACLVMLAIFFMVFIGIMALATFMTIKEEANTNTPEASLQALPNALELDQIPGESLRNI